MSQSFAELGLPAEILHAVEKVGYEAPTPIQAAAIPPLLAGRDVLGQAQTGTGKTAAFALPLLGRLDLSRKRPQILVMTPTRELALQVAEAFQTYSRGLKGFHVLPVYGGQNIDVQLRHLRKGVHAVVGTPGRILDHLRRNTLDLSVLSSVVLDEADEMLRMGFLDDVEEILRHTPEQKQVALFSATLPDAIARVAGEHLREPVDVEIEAKTATVAAVSQHYWKVSGVNKLHALTRILEVEDFDAMLVFVRTKVATVELAEKLEARGFASSALNGDMSQALRERTVQRLKNEQLDIVVATDVAARGLDVDRISHVINFDVPYDTEAYIHRIGRTGRAGRTGKAILFVTPRERSMLRAIERANRQPLEPMALPTHADVVERRAEQFKESITEAIDEQDLDFFRHLVRDFAREQETSLDDVAAALAYLAQRDRPLMPPKREERRPENPGFGDSRRDDSRPGRGRRDEGLETYRVEVGQDHGVQPKNLVGAIANEANIDGRRIGRIDIRSSHSLIDLPEGMPPDIFNHLSQVEVFGQTLRLQKLSHQKIGGAPEAPQKSYSPGPDQRKPKGKGKHKGKDGGSGKSKGKRKAKAPGGQGFKPRRRPKPSDGGKPKRKPGPKRGKMKSGKKTLREGSPFKRFEK